jgi:preprotein translocase subunit SecA
MALLRAPSTTNGSTISIRWTTCAIPSACVPWGNAIPLLEYKQDSYELFQTLLIRIYEQVVQTLFRVTDPEVRKKRRIEIHQTEESAKKDNMQQILDRSNYMAADKQADSSFASFDTGRLALAGQQAAADGAGPAKAARKPKDGPAKVQTVRRTEAKVKPNDPCPCGSGKKYKKCCGAHGD